MQQGTKPEQESLGLHLSELNAVNAADEAAVTAALEAAVAAAAARAPPLAPDAATFLAKVAPPDQQADVVDSPSVFVANLRNHAILRMRRTAFTQEIQAAVSEAMATIAKRDTDKANEEIKVLQGQVCVLKIYSIMRLGCR